MGNFQQFAWLGVATEGGYFRTLTAAPCPYFELVRKVRAMADFGNVDLAFNRPPGSIVRKDNGVSNTDLLRLMDILTIHDACALIAGCSPSQVVEDWHDNEKYYYLRTNDSDPPNADEVFTLSLKAMTRAIEKGILKADISVMAYNGTYQKLIKKDLSLNWMAIHGIDPTLTTVTRDDLKEWLEQRGVYPTMLFPHGRKDDYMNQAHDHYAPKLALCVRAWEVAQTAIIDGETQKQFMERWMRENASDFGVDNKSDAKIFRELATIPNWDTKGGKVKSNLTPHSEPLIDEAKVSKNLATVRQKLEVNLPDERPKKPDDDIPF